MLSSALPALSMNDPNADSNSQPDPNPAQVHRLWRLAGTKGREVLDIELRWLGVMSDPDAAT